MTWEQNNWFLHPHLIVSPHGLLALLPIEGADPKFMEFDHLSVAQCTRVFFMDAELIYHRRDTDFQNVFNIKAVSFQGQIGQTGFIHRRGDKIYI